MINNIFSKKFLILIFITPLVMVFVFFYLASIFTNKGPSQLKPVSVYPSINSTDVSIFPKVGVVFSKPVLDSETSNIHLTINPTVYGSYYWSTDKKQIYLQVSQQLKTSQTYTATLYFFNRTFSWDFTTASSDNLSKSDQQRAQGESDVKFLNSQQQFLEKYPWYNNIPPKNNDYFIVFDSTTDTFYVLVYTKSASTVPQQTQVINIENEVRQVLKNIGVNIQAFKFVWKIIPQ